jgi:hypothetical protein|tara:strand:- start:3572 stop:3892 length:321 start_codon:yes stop_codon:yes gene_type:complete
MNTVEYAMTSLETRYDRIFSPEDDLAAVVPIHTLDALERYIRDRLPPGGFLTAVLSNDLVGAFGAADSTNVEAMKEIIVFIYNRIPSSSWGSKEKVNAWIANREEA